MRFFIDCTKASGNAELNLGKNIKDLSDGMIFSMPVVDHIKETINYANEIVRMTMPVSNLLLDKLN